MVFYGGLASLGVLAIISGIPPPTFSSSNAPELIR